MKYMLLVYGQESSWDDSAFQACISESTELCHELQAKGQFLGASPLRPVATATSVRVRDGKREVTDGPFAETHEQLGGYYLIDVPDLDAAIEIAGRIPAVNRGTVEVRPVYELQGLP